MRRVLLFALGAVIAVAALAAVVLIPVAGNLNDARSALTGDVTELDQRDLFDARVEIQEASRRLDRPAAKLLGAIPILGSNVRAVESVVDTAPAVLDAALDLNRVVLSVGDRGLIDDGKIRLRALDDLEGLFDRQVIALQNLEEASTLSRTGTLLPPVWGAMDDLSEQAAALRANATTMKRLTPHLGPLFGSDEPRTYLLLLMNNAELRGAGGILAGVGTLVIDRGRIELGSLNSIHDLREFPPRPVPAPATYERRFSEFKANTTLWLNTTFSPDVPDVGLVAARLFERVTGRRTDGAIAIDPRGIAALLPSESELSLPGLSRRITPEELPSAVYSDAYEAFDDQIRRRNAILQLGAQAFSAILDDGLADLEAVAAAGEAVGGGHLNFISFHDREARLLGELGVARDLTPADGDSVLVTVQNFGGGGREGSKIDYWIRRDTEHACEVADDGSALCATSVTLYNETPQDLVRYVAGSPYGLSRNYVEIYVPAEADLEEVRVQGESAEFRPERHDDRVALGLYVEIARGQKADVSVVYRLPGDGPSYELVAMPQPLATDARFRLAVGLPEDWDVEGSGRLREGALIYSGAFDRTLKFEAHPSNMTGLPALWDALKDFWTEPLL